MSRLSDDRGQSTLEYAGVLTVLALVITVAGAATMAPNYLNATWGGFQRALCIVTGRECRALDEQACVVRSNSEGRTLSATIVFVRLEDGRLLLQERLSDGRIRITVTASNGAGVEGGIGASAGVDYKGIRLDASAEANAALLGLYGRGKVYVARDAGEAQRLVRAIQDGRARTPDATFHEGGLRGELSATAGAGAALGRTAGGKKDEKDDDDAGGRDVSTGPLGEVSAGLGATLSRAVGRRVDRRTGETTWYLRADNEVSASAGASIVGMGKAGGEATANGDGMLSVTTDRRGRVVAVGAHATYGAGADYQVSGGPKGSAGGRRHEVEVTADPDDPTILAALSRLRRDPGASGLKALTAAVYERGRVDRRTYELGGDSEGVDGSIALGAKLAGGYEQSTGHARLVDASSKPPGGVWEQRFDCLERA